MQAKNGFILAIGGAEDKFDKRTLLSRFVKEAGGAKSRIAVVPTASSIAEKRAAFYQNVFTGLGAAEAYPVLIDTRADAETPAFGDLFSRATGIFLTGGDQSRLVSLLGESPAFAAMAERWRHGAVIAGTSAAASAFSGTMIVGGGTGLVSSTDSVELGTGFGLLPELIIDQHFSQRERLGRLLSAVVLRPDRVGVGLDEDTAIGCHPDGELEVLGSGRVYLLDARAAGKPGLSGSRAPSFTLSRTLIHILAEGDFFAIPTGEVRNPLTEAAGGALA